MQVSSPKDSAPDADAADEFSRSRVVNLVFDRLLKSVQDGQLVPGQRVSDSELAQELGVSRTPVREALQRLREIGIIEVSASRFTRIAVVSPQQTADAMVVWVALYRALVDEVISQVTPGILDRMQADHRRFLSYAAAMDAPNVAKSNAEFFAHLVDLSTNAALQRGINSVVHIIHLGSLHLPDYIDLRALSESQALMIAAARDHDRSAGQGALRMLEVIRIPAEPTE